MGMQLTLHTRGGCDACIKAKELLAAAGEEYDEVLKETGLVPVLERNGETYVLYGQNGEWAFAKAAVK
jgi:arsenate reductase-like glutaredoxin family protein